jgi:hypothetical protein
MRLDYTNSLHIHIINTDGRISPQSNLDSGRVDVASSTRNRLNLVCFLGLAACLESEGDCLGYGVLAGGAVPSDSEAGCEESDVLAW